MHASIGGKQHGLGPAGRTGSTPMCGHQNSQNEQAMHAVLAVGVRIRTCVRDARNGSTVCSIDRR